MTGQQAVRPVVISPFSNERVREWPIANYRRFIARVLADHGIPVAIVGTRTQRVRANELVRGFPYPEVVNTCGELSWRELIELVDAAPYVVANNSGVAHLAATRGCWTLCIFSGSHSWVEWMPRGPRVVVVTRVTDCAPCALGGEPCPNGVACMSDLHPDAAFDLFEEARTGRRDYAGGRPTTWRGAVPESRAGRGAACPATVLQTDGTIMSAQSPAFERRFTIAAGELSCHNAYGVGRENALRQDGIIEFDASRHGGVEQPVLFYGPYISVEPGVYLFTCAGELDGNLQIRFTHQSGKPIKQLAIDSFDPILLVLTRRVERFEVVGVRTPELKSMKLKSIAVHHIDPSRPAAAAFRH